jgi:hypothetical protein
MDGTHDATVSMSMSLRMKNLGNVPPRLDTLFDVNVSTKIDKLGVDCDNLRCKKSHVSSAVHGIRNLRMEGRYSYKHDCVHECAENMAHNYK